MIVRLTWQTPDVEGTALRFSSAVGGGVERPATAGGSGAEGPSVPLVGATVVMAGSAPGSDRLVLGGLSDAPEDERAALRGQPRLLGLGWATVDADRASVEVAERLGLEPGTFHPGPPDEWLLASARIARLGSLVVALLEPTGEGRLAAALARTGEGPCALYVTSLASGPARSTPLGSGSLVMADRPWGPFVLTLRRSPGSPRPAPASTRA